MVCSKTGLKAIALSFLFLANTIMLAHSIVPHHHHNGLIFTLTTEHHNDGDDDAHHDDNCDYPNCNDGIENCELSMIYISFGNEKQIFQPYDCNFNVLLCVFILFSDDSIPPIANDIGIPFRQNPYLQLYHSDDVTQSHGLRAPPVC